MKKVFQLVMILLIAGSLVCVYADDNISVVLNGEKIEFDVQPQLINDRTMVPMRAIFESLGATVEWDEATQTVKAQKEDTAIVLTIGSEYMYVNDTAVLLDSPACIVDGRTLAPVRAVSEAFGINVAWDDGTRTVTIGDTVASDNDIPEYDEEYIVAQIMSIVGLPNDGSITYAFDTPEFNRQLGEYVVRVYFYENGVEEAIYGWCINTNQFYTQYVRY